MSRKDPTSSRSMRAPASTETSSRFAERVPAVHEKPRGEPIGRVVVVTVSSPKDVGGEPRLPSPHGASACVTTRRRDERKVLAHRH